MRMAMYLSYPIYLLAAVLAAPKDSIFIVSSNTFYAALLVSLVGKLKGIRTINLVYDLFPDALEVSGKLKPSGLGANLLGFFSRWAQQSSSTSVFLGEFLRSHAERRWGPAEPCSAAIHIGADSSLFRIPSFEVRDGPLVLHYGGQLGYMHDPDSLIASVARIKEVGALKEIRVSFLVSGAYALKVHKTLIPLGIEVEGAIPSDEWRKRIADFHIGLVSLSPGGATVCLPSKTYAMMAGGLAIIAICPAWSDLARLIIDHDAGWVVNNSPYESMSELDGENYLERVRATRPLTEVTNDFLSAVSHAASDRKTLQEKRRNAHAAVGRCYSRRRLAQAWSELLEELDKRSYR